MMETNFESQRPSEDTCFADTVISLVEEAWKARREERLSEAHEKLIYET